MPIYEYVCQECEKVFETIRPMSQADVPIPCASLRRKAYPAQTLGLLCRERRQGCLRDVRTILRFMRRRVIARTADINYLTIMTEGSIDNFSTIRLRSGAPGLIFLEVCMEYTQLGRTGLKVSRLCLGTMNFGPQTNETDSFAIMDKALELGINFFDTANVYGWKTGRGRHRADRRALVRPGRRTAREGRPCHQGLRADGRLAEYIPTCRRCTSARPASSPSSACRPTTSTCTRCTTLTASPPGRRSGRPWKCWSSRAR